MARDTPQGPADPEHLPPTQYVFGVVEQAEQIAHILHSYHAYLVKYFGRWITTEFPS